MIMKEIEVETYPGGRMDSDNAAKYLKLSTNTLAKMRSLGTGPRYIKKGGIWYYRSDLDDWLKEGGKLSKSSHAKVRVSGPSK